MVRVVHDSGGVEFQACQWQGDNFAELELVVQDPTLLEFTSGRTRLWLFGEYAGASRWNLLLDEHWVLWDPVNSRVIGPVDPYSFGRTYQ